MNTVTAIYQSPADAAYAQRAMDNGAPVDFAGPGEPGWYVTNDAGDILAGPFEVEVSALTFADQFNGMNAALAQAEGR